MKVHEKLGPIARQLCWLFDAWIVGGSVPYLYELTEQKPKDIDIVVSLENWIVASKLIPEGAISNKFGGFKFQDGEFEIDVWCDDIPTLFINNIKGRNNLTAYQPKHNLRIGAL